MDPLIPSTSAAVPLVDSPIAATPIEYAGFWRRVGASLVDGSIFGFAITIIIVLATLAHAPHIFMLILIYVVLIALYIIFAWQESSVWQGTIGKKLFGLTVTDMEGNRITFARAIGRNFAKIVSSIILYIGYMMAGFTEKKQGLHDIMANTLVVKTKPAKTGQILLAIFGPSILSGVVFALFLGTAFSGLLLGYELTRQPNDLSTVQDSSSTSDNNSITGDADTKLIATTSDQYDTAFENEKADQSIFDNDTSSKILQTSTGPALLAIAQDNLSDSSDGLDLAVVVPDIPNILNSNTEVTVVITHVYTTKGTDVYDAADEQDSDTSISLDTQELDSGTYHTGLRSIGIKENAVLTKSNFSSIVGTINFSLPNADGSTYTKSYPFTISSKQ